MLNYYSEKWKKDQSVLNKRLFEIRNGKDGEIISGSPQKKHSWFKLFKKTSLPQASRPVPSPTLDQWKKQAGLLWKEWKVLWNLTKTLLCEWMRIPTQKQPLPVKKDAHPSERTTKTADVLNSNLKKRRTFPIDSMLSPDELEKLKKTAGAIRSIIFLKNKLLDQVALIALPDRI